MTMEAIGQYIAFYGYVLPIFSVDIVTLIMRLHSFKFRTAF